MKIALLGAGLMGQPMAERLLASGHEVVVYNRTREKAEQLKPKGAAIAEEPDQAIRSAACVILMLADAQAIRQVLMSGTTWKALAGRTVIQMGTIAPSESQALQRDVMAAGGEYLEAPVLGSIPEAQAGNLVVMVGGGSDQFERWVPLLQCLGQTPRLIGPVGQAAAVKLALNQLIASLTSAFALSLGLVLRAQVPVDMFMTVLRQSALYAPTFDKKLSRLLDRDYANPNFPTRHLLKDVDLFLSEAGHVGLETGVLEGLRRLLEQTVAENWGNADYSALFNVVNPGPEVGR
jgi:3-hydroxyisobutyrate dehydrogenase-like beta-hydroxyacid dehydrogenase